MKKIFLMIVLLGAASIGFSKDKVETPYTLYGAPEDCSLEVLETGFEKNLVKRPRPIKGKKFYADVTVSDFPDVVFHLKWMRGGKYVASDGNTGLRLLVSGGSPLSPMPFLRGSYRVWQDRQPVGRCVRLWQKK